MIYYPSLRSFTNYRWLLSAIQVKDAERRRTHEQIRDGLLSRDLLDADWNTVITQEIDRLKERLRAIERAIDAMPETPELLPCKLFMRLYYLFGLSLSDTAMRMCISYSTARRLQKRCAAYFENHPTGDL